MLKKAGGDFNIENGSALTWAVRMQDLSLVQFLFSESLYDWDHVEAIFFAVLHGEDKILKCLFENGAIMSAEILIKISDLMGMKKRKIRKMINKELNRSGLIRKIIFNFLIPDLGNIILEYLQIRI